MDNAAISTIAFISLLAAISPGPDFAIVTKNCLTGNFLSGVLTAFGVAAALLVHITYCLFGMVLRLQAQEGLNTQSPILQHVL